MTLFQESLNPDRSVRWRGLPWCWEAEPGRLGPLFQNVFILFPTWTSNYSNAKCLMILLTVYPMKYAYGFVVLCFVVVMQSFIMNSHEVFIHIHQGCFAGTGAIVRLPQCQWSKPDGYGKISQCKTTTKHSKAKTVCIFRGICCIIHQKFIGAAVEVWDWIRNFIAHIMRHVITYLCPDQY